MLDVLINPVFSQQMICPHDMLLHQMSCDTIKCALRSLSLSYPKKDWQAGMTPTTEYSLWRQQSSILWSIVSVIPKEGSFFGYDNDKYLKALFLMTWLVLLASKFCVVIYPLMVATSFYTDLKIYFDIPVCKWNLNFDILPWSKCVKFERLFFHSVRTYNKLKRDKIQICDKNGCRSS